MLTSLLSGALLAGCTKPTGDVSGTVSYNGKNLTSGSVTFTPESGGAVFAKIESDGKYLAKKVPVGQAKVTVQAGSATDTDTLKSVQRPNSPEEMKKIMMPQVKKKESKIPPKYSDPEATDLIFDVKTGPQEYPITLK